MERDLRDAAPSRLGPHLTIAVTLLIGFVILYSFVSSGATQSWDDATVLALRSNGSPADPIGPPWMEEAGRDVTALGSHIVLIFLVLSSLGYLALLRRWLLARMLLASITGAIVISALLKMGIDRPRPEIPHAARVFTASFPSGHATLSTVVFLTLGALLAQTTDRVAIKRYFVGLSIFLTAAVGISRLYLGVHYPSDVLAGWLVGGAWALICWTVVSRSKPQLDNIATLQRMR